MAKGFSNPFRAFSIQKLFIFVAITIFLVQVVSLAITSVFSDVPLIKTGNLVLILSVALTFVFLANVGFSGEFKRTDILGIVLLGGITVAIYIYGGQLFPEIFSIVGDSALNSAQSLQSSIGLP
jgi:hypothetical protein|tara:strand:+ start:5339 stop:5710 length:372 start_codon:yes stop_codon:yes gene_type:complete